MVCLCARHVCLSLEDYCGVHQEGRTNENMKSHPRDSDIAVGAACVNVGGRCRDSQRKCKHFLTLKNATSEISPCSILLQTGLAQPNAAQAGRAPLGPCQEDRQAVTCRNYHLLTKQLRPRWAPVEEFEQTTSHSDGFRQIMLLKQAEKMAVSVPKVVRRE